MYPCRHSCCREFHLRLPNTWDPFRSFFVMNVLKFSQITSSPHSTQLNRSQRSCSFSEIFVNINILSESFCLLLLFYFLFNFCFFSLYFTLAQNLCGRRTNEIPLIPSYWIFCLSFYTSIVYPCIIFSSVRLLSFLQILFLSISLGNNLRQIRLCSLCRISFVEFL